MKTVFTVRLPEEYACQLEAIKLELDERGIEIPSDSVLLKTVLITGIRDINRMLTKGINIFADAGNQETDD